MNNMNNEIKKMMSELHLNYPVNLLPHVVTARVQTLVESDEYNISLLNIPEAWKETQGEGIKVAVLDAGRPNHPDLVIAGSKSFVPGYDEDKCGHDTHVCGIIRATAGNGIGIRGIAPLCDIYAGVVLGAEGSGELDWIVKGIYWAVDEVKADIINMSLGLDASAPTVKTLLAACNYAKSKGVTVICAAGNEYGKVGQPARYNSVIAVAAVDSAEKHADFSNAGPEVDFATGGVDIFSTYLNNGYAKLSGTSMASPALTGVATLILASYKKEGVILTPDDLYEHIKGIAFDVGPKGFDNQYGWGIPFFKSKTTGQDVIDTPTAPVVTPAVPVIPWWRRFINW